MKALIGAALAVLLGQGHALGADFHALFEARCLRCHGHAGAFAADRLHIEDGRVVGSGGLDVAKFLGSHAGGLTAEERDLFVQVFRRQVEAGGFYAQRCRSCHDRAYDLARSKLFLRDDVLVGRYSGRDIANFLTGHARLSAQEAAEMTDALRELTQGRR